MLYKIKLKILSNSRFDLVVNAYSFLKRSKFKRFSHWLLRGHITRRIVVRHWLNNNKYKYMQIGGGKHFINEPSWINGDLIDGNIYINATKRLPIPNNTVDVVFTEQFIEHLPRSEGLQFMREVYRVLKFGGVFRQSTPDLDKLMLLAQDDNSEVKLKDAIQRHIANHKSSQGELETTGCQFINDMFRLWGHKFIYDKITLELSVKSAGFNKLFWKRFGKSNCKCLEERERHADTEWMKNGFNMILEAYKEH